VQSDKEFMAKINKADNELREHFLEMLNSKRGCDTPKITKVAFQPSIVMSKVHHTQDAHWDYVKEHQSKYEVAFLPLTKTGQFLQVWEYEESRTISGEKVEGNLVFLPGAELMMMSGKVLHGGGFRAEARPDDRGAHLRIHFYVYPGETRCPIDIHRNENFDRPKNHPRKARLSETYVNNKLLEGRLKEKGPGCDSLAWTFFQGKCPFDMLAGVEKKRKHTRKRQKIA